MTGHRAGQLGLLHWSMHWLHRLCQAARSGTPILRYPVPVGLELGQTVFCRLDAVILGQSTGLQREDTILKRLYFSSSEPEFVVITRWLRFCICARPAFEQARHRIRL